MEVVKGGVRGGSMGERDMEDSKGKVVRIEASTKIANNNVTNM